MGLLLLRAAVGVTAFIEGGVYLTDPAIPAFWMRLLGLLGVLGGISLMIGFLTPVAAVLVALGATGVAFSWFPSPVPRSFDTTLATIFVIVMTVAVVFLGPGALSLDARLFGRREIIIPRTSRSSE